MARKKKTQDYAEERSFRNYFNDISKFMPMTKSEEMNLWLKYKNENDLSARDKLITSNLKFVANIARQYQGRGLSYADLISEGNMGLLKSIEKFDHTKNIKTISYSVWWIRQAIMEAISNKNKIATDDIPESPEGEEQLVDQENIKNLDNEEEKPYITDELQESWDCPYNLYIVGMLTQALTEKERFVIEKCFGLDGNKPVTLEEIGKEMGLTKERVRQYKEKAMKKMRSMALSVFQTK